MFNSEIMPEITMDEIDTAIQKIERNRAVGQILMELIKEEEEQLENI